MMRIKNSLKIFSKITLLCTLSSFAMAADNLLDEIVERGQLRVGTTGDYKPFSYKLTKETANLNEAYIGFDVELAQNLADQLGVKLEIVPTTWSNLVVDLKDKKYDIAMAGVSVTLDRQKIGYYSIPYLRDGKTPITLCSNQSRFQTLEQIDQPQTVAIVNPGGTNQRFANAHLKKATIKVHPDNVTIFTQIIEGKADLMMTDAVETRLQEKIHPELCAVHPETPFDFSEKAYLMPRDIVFQQFVNQWLRQLMESGEFNRRFDQWLNYSWQAADKE